LRPGAVALTSLVAAVLGAVGVLVAARAGGWIGDRERTVVVRQAVGDGGSAAPVVAAKPLAGNGFQPAQIYRSRAAGVVTIYSFFRDSTGSAARAGQGSGFVVARDGVVLTNAHVITTAGENAGGDAAPAREVYVEFQDGDRVSAHIVGWDLFDDVGVLRVDPRDHALAPVPLGDSSRVVVGQPVAAIGSPFGNENSLSVGVVSGTRREINSLTSKFDLIDAIQTDAPINHGNSGGPLFDARGRVIGINAQIRSSEGSGFEGVGFAVPIDSARRSMRQLLDNGRVAYAYVGITTEDLTPAIAKKFGYAARKGAIVRDVLPGKAGARAGLRPATRTETFNGLELHVGGDAIVAINGEPVANAGDVVRIVSERLVPDQVARFTIVRGNRRLVLPVRLDDRSEAPS
jgi:S1-C subfamily serine protease